MNSSLTYFIESCFVPHTCLALKKTSSSMWYRLVDFRLEGIKKLRQHETFAFNRFWMEQYTQKDNKKLQKYILGKEISCIKLFYIQTTTSTQTHSTGYQRLPESSVPLERALVWSFHFPPDVAGWAGFRLSAKFSSISLVGAFHWCLLWASARTKPTPFRSSN